MIGELVSLAQNVRHAGRRLRREPLAAGAIIVTVGLGLGLVAAVYTILNSMIFSVDEVHNPHELFSVERQRSAIVEAESYTRTEYETLVRESGVFSAAFASTSDTNAWIEGARRQGRLVTGNFFQVLGVRAFLGSVFAPPHDEAGSPPVIVLSHRAWVQYYRSDPDVLAGTHRINGTVFRIIGVMPEGFRGLEILAAPDFWAPLAHIDIFQGRRPAEDSEFTGDLNVVGRLTPGLSRIEAVARLNAWDLRNATQRSAELSARLTLVPRPGTVQQTGQTMLSFVPLFFAFGLVLLIGCANVANLLLARLIKRQREFGIRLAIGATRLRVVLQLLTENLLLAVIASVLAFVISRLILNGIVYWVTTSFPPDIGNLRIAVPPADWRVMLFLLFSAVVATVLFALAPALRATRFDLARSNLGRVSSDGRPGRVRNALIVLQVTASALLLICAAIFLRGAWSAANVDPGIRIADVVSVTVNSEPRREEILNSLRSAESVGAVAAAWPGALGGAPASAEGANGSSVVLYQYVSPEYFAELEVDLVRGRGFFDRERDPNESVVIVSQSAARELWPGIDPIGQVLRVEPDHTISGVETGPAANGSLPVDRFLEARTAVVIGVARDVPGFLIAGMRVSGADIYLPVSAESPGTSLVARVSGDVLLAQAALVDRFAAIDPNLAEVSTLQRLTRANEFLLGISFQLTLALGSLALLLTITGLFSVLSYLVEQRTKEIGVRMALGASNRSIGRLVLSQLARPVGIGLMLGGVLTAGLGAALLSTPVAEQVAATVKLFDPFAYVVSLLLILSACAGAALIPALRAGRVDPINALRQN